MTDVGQGRDGGGEVDLIGLAGTPTPRHPGHSGGLEGAPPTPTGAVDGGVETDDGREAGGGGEAAASVDSATDASAVAPHEEPAPVAEVPAAPAGRPRRSRPSWVAAAASVLAVVLLVVAALSYSALRHREATDKARTTALAAARTYALDLGYDYQHLDQDFGVVLAHSTPGFAQSYRQSTGALKAVLIRFKASAKASVVGAGVESASTSHAQVLVFLDLIATNQSQKSGPTTSLNRLRMSLVHGGSGWQIDQIETVK